MEIKIQDAFKIINTTLGVNNGPRDMPSQKNGILQLLLSNANKAAARVKLGAVEVDKNDGKSYVVSRTYNPRLGESGGNATMQYCPTSGTELKPYSDVVKITKNTTSNPIKISDELMRCIQQNKQGYVSEYFRDYVRTHLNALAVQVAKAAADKKGNFVRCDCEDAPTDCKDLPLFFSTIGFGLNPVGEAILRQDAMEADLMNDLILVGGSPLLSNYQLAKNFASGNQLGFDVSLLDLQRSVFFDPNLSTALGDPDQILAIAPGALQMITYNKHKGAFRHTSDTQQRVTVIDPFYGIEHDLLIYVNECADEIEMFMQLSTNWELVGVPDCRDEDCKFEGVKDIFCYTAVCADTKMCDITSPCGSQDTATAIDTFCSSAETCETFPVEILAFDDADNNDVQDGGELGVAAIVVEVYTDVTETNLFASATTDATGIAAFNLPAGTYYVDITAASLTAAGHILNVTLPWVMVITNTGTVLYPGWSESGKLPLGTEVIP